MSARSNRTRKYLLLDTDTHTYFLILAFGHTFLYIKDIIKSRSRYKIKRQIFLLNRNINLVINRIILISTYII